MTSNLAATPTLTRGQLARVCSVGSETIRYYEREGLLPAAERSAAGYRQFGSDAVPRLNFIRRAKALGFTLQEIAELLALQDDGQDRARVKAIAEDKLAEIDAKLLHLKRMRDALAGLAVRCSGRGPLVGCPIIQALTDDQAEPALNAEDGA